MRNPITRIVGASVISLILILLMGNYALAAGSQSWYLTSTPAGIQAEDGTLHSANNIMNKIEPTSPWPGMRFIGAIGKSDLTAWWYSDSPALGDVTFGENSWSAQLYYINLFGSGNLHAEVYSVSPDGFVITLLATGTATVSWRDKYTQVLIECADYNGTTQTVPQGYYLALRLRYDPAQFADGIMLFFGSEQSPARLQSPPTDPGFPLPELSTIVLLAGGLVSLAGYVGWRYRKRHTVKEVAMK